MSITGYVMLSSAALSFNIFAGGPEYPAEYQSSQYKNNCVKFVKYEMGVNFPEGTDLSTWQAKVNLINRSIDECPESGWVAIVDTRD